jgi:hypothetical protein
LSNEIIDKADLLKFNISGPDLNEESGYDLFYMSESIRNFRTLVEKTYLVTSSGKHMGKTDRNRLKIKAYNIREGSFEADMAIIIKDVSLSMIPLVTSTSPKEIWNLIKTTFNYLKKVLIANQEGEKLSLEVNDSPNVTVVNGNGNIVFTGHRDVITTAKATYPTFKKIGKLIDESGGMTNFSVSDATNEEENVHIGGYEKMLLTSTRQLEEQTVNVLARITKVDVEKFTGKLEILEEKSDFLLDNYPFEFLNKQDKHALASLTYKEKTFNVMKVTSFDPTTLEKTIIQLKVCYVLEE